MAASLSIAEEFFGLEDKKDDVTGARHDAMGDEYGDLFGQPLAGRGDGLANRLCDRLLGPGFRPRLMPSVREARRVLPLAWNMSLFLRLRQVDPTEYPPRTYLWSLSSCDALSADFLREEFGGCVRRLTRAAEPLKGTAYSAIIGPPTRKRNRFCMATVLLANSAR
jgi:hypothetical protein